MLDFNYLKRMTEGFMPKTPHTALKAIEERKVPIEAFVYIGTSVKPILEKPYDMDEIEKILGRRNLPVETYILLKRIFNDLVKSPDQEIALAAAEGINEIENIFNSRIEKLKEKLEEEPNEASYVLELARTYYEFSRVNRDKAAIETFYLREAFSYIKELARMKGLDVEAGKLLVRILVALKLYDQAFRVLGNLKGEDDPEVVFLKAQVEFQRRNLSEVFQYCVELTQFEGKLDDRMKRVLAFWIGF